MSCPYAQQQQQQQSYSGASRSRSRYADASSSAYASYSTSRRSNANRSGYQRSQSYAGAAQNFQSQVEQAVINARQPIQTNETAQVTAGQFRGTYLNKQEVDNWRGPVPVEQYQINEDSNPEVIRKRLDKVRYQQEVSVRYLNPPSPPKPGDLIIRERQGQIPPAPPVVLREEGCQAKTPEPAIYREQPPRRPPCVPEQVIEVEGEPVAPPARRVVVEKLTNLPPKPQNVIIEKWLPYKQQRRRVVYQRSCAQRPQNPRNLVIEWEAPDVEVEKVCRNLGTVNADPEEYVRRYGNELRQPCEIPNLCPENSCNPCQQQQRPRTPTPQPPTPQCGCPQQRPRTPTPPPPPPAPACNQCSGSQSRASSAVPELEGDVDALRLVDLERHGLGAYRRYLH